MADGVVLGAATGLPFFDPPVSAIAAKVSPAMDTTMARLAARTRWRRFRRRSAALRAASFASW